jgi:hypothetical protein
MTKEEVQAIFLLAGMPVENLYEIKNEYWPQAYVKEIAADPWWLVKTEYGLIKIGWRKRVINIDWVSTRMRLKHLPQEGELGEHGLTTDDVTKSESNIHAWTFGKTIDYISILKLRFQQFTYVNTEEGKADMIKRRAAGEWEKST